MSYTFWNLLSVQDVYCSLDYQDIEINAFTGHLLKSRLLNFRGKVQLRTVIKAYPSIRDSRVIGNGVCDEVNNFESCENFNGGDCIMIKGPAIYGKVTAKPSMITEETVS